jgi:hypothetical protein
MSAPAPDASINSQSVKDIFSAYAPAAGWIAGLVTVLVSLIVQIFTINHGTSGQLTIDTGMHAAIWPALIGATIFAFSFTIWIMTQKDEKYKFIYLFLLVSLSYLLSNVALFYSTRQVKVATT